MTAGTEHDSSDGRAAPKRPIVMPFRPFGHIASKRRRGHDLKRLVMLRKILAVALAAGLVAALPSASAFAAAAKDKEAPKERVLTPQQAKMMDCAVKWGEEKAKTGKKGRAAYNAFMRDCLKKPAA
jgi:hypothetical protein